ncbi:hypothetical protein AB4Y72_16375 [Arthrobacter sp. YAF34]|uniref:hypothetical protein n=1 Tax=Arthrobacter sp. YAF34 TaxID=3233083 RepID=UPI003F8E60E8
MSLLNLAPEALAAALPSLAATRRGGSWPVGLLPLEQLADELAAFGYRYKRGPGFTCHGASADPYDVASTAALILNMAADALTYSGLLGDAWAEAADELESHADRVQMETHAALGDDYELAEAVAAPLTAFSDATARRLRHLLESPEGTVAEREAALLGDRFNEHAEALRRTARDVKASPAAQRPLLTALRSLLPAPEEATVDEAAALGFLASLDSLDVLKRSELVVRYDDADRPGDLGDYDLRALAEARWGAPKPLRGIYVYRPARAAA